MSNTRTTGLEDLDLDQTPASQLLAAAGVEMMTTMQEFLSHLAVRAGTTPQQLVVFGAIRRGDATRVGDVAAQTATSPSAASRTVDALVAAGHVHRAADPDDRRAQVLSVTTAGESWAAEQDEHVQSMLGQAAADLSDDDVRHLVATQLELARALRTAIRVRS